MSGVGRQVACFLGIGLMVVEFGGSIASLGEAPAGGDNGAAKVLRAAGDECEGGFLVGMRRVVGSLRGRFDGGGLTAGQRQEGNEEDGRFHGWMLVLNITLQTAHRGRSHRAIARGLRARPRRQGAGGASGISDCLHRLEPASAAASCRVTTGT